MNARLCIAAISLGVSLAAPSGATPTLDLADKPLASTPTATIKPNVMFILDDSGSMARDYMPDDVPNTSYYGRASAQCNGVAYDPTITYTPPMKSDGSSFADADFGNARNDGYWESTGTTTTTNLGPKISSSTSVSVGTGSKTWILTSSSPTSVRTVGAIVLIHRTAEGMDGPNRMLGTVTAFNSTTRQITISVSSSWGGGSYSDWQVVALPYYFQYSGAEPPISYTYDVSTGAVITSTNFYKQCKTTIGSAPPGGATFTKVAVVTAAERQNYANWWSYYRTRMNTMKTAMTLAFGQLLNPANYRIGYTTISYSGTTATSNSYLPIGDYCSAADNCSHRQNFFTRIFKAEPSGYTPLRNALSKAGLIFAGKLGTDPVQYSCQQNFSILSTDGYWNNGADTWADSGGFKLPAGTGTGYGSAGVGQHDGSSNTDYDGATVKRPRLDDGGGSGYSSTLADVAMYYYKNDLRESGRGNCTGILGLDVCKNNVPGAGEDLNTKQHMTTFTLGLGVNGTLGYAETYASGGSADFNAIISGTKKWPNPTSEDARTVDDLWHAAVNGRGYYYNARDTASLISGISKALAGVTARLGAGAAAATSNLEPIAGDNYAYVAQYTTVQWDGDLQSRSIDLSSGVLASTASKSARDELDAWISTNPTAAGRKIYMVKSGVRDDFAAANLADADFDPADLSQYTSLTATEKTFATKANLVGYLRGATGYEDQAGNTYRLFRDRLHSLGDIVHSQPIYVKQPRYKYDDSGYMTYKSTPRAGVVYAGANDGMLHAFDAESLAENWAFVPTAVIPKLHQLADFGYSTAHQFFVDGVIAVGDIDAGGWKALLVGGLGKGGRAYYALDVSSPSSPTVRWEFTNDNLGYSFGNPIITKRDSDNKWVVLLTSGYKNTSPGDGKTHLFVLDAYTGALLEDIVPADSEATPDKSGLAKVNNWVDSIMTNNKTRYVYGGDLNGNLWRFDINAGSAVKLAEFRDPGGTPQSVTTMPELGEIVTGSTKQKVVYVGTGRYLGPADITDAAVAGQTQTLYAVKDTGTSHGNFRSAAGVVEIGISSGRVIDYSPVPVSSPGWFADFDAEAGERVNVDPKLQMGWLGVVTNIPDNSDVCSVGGTSWVYFFEYNPQTDRDSDSGEVVYLGNSITSGFNILKLPDGKGVGLASLASGEYPAPPLPPGVPGNTVRRVSWRELIN